MTEPKRDFVPIAPNPYIVGNPVRDPQMFFGREAEFELIYRRFKEQAAEGGLIVLCGERRSGKTSILFQIMNGRLGYEFIPVLIDMQSMAIENEADFLARVANEISAAYDKYAGGSQRSELAAELEEFTRTIAERSDGAAAPTGNRDRLNRLDAFSGFVKAAQRLNPGHKLILLFDEYELFETKIDTGALTKEVLRVLAHLMESHGVFMLFTGSLSLNQRKREYWELILGRSTYRQISFLGRRDAERLITEPVKNMVEYEPGVVDAIIRLTAGQPFYTQAICQKLIDHLNEQRTNVVTLKAVDHVVRDIVANPFPQMIFLWKGLSRDEKLALSLLGESLKGPAVHATVRDLMRVVSRQRYPISIGSGLIATALAGLYDREMLLKDDRIPAGYAFKMDLWRLWIRPTHSVWQVMRELGIKFKPPVPRWIPISGVAMAVAVVLLVGGKALVRRPSPSMTGAQVRTLNFEGAAIEDVIRPLSTIFDTAIVVLPEDAGKRVTIKGESYSGLDEALRKIAAHSDFRHLRLRKAIVVGSATSVARIREASGSPGGLAIIRSSSPGALIQLVDLPSESSNNGILTTWLPVGEHQVHVSEPAFGDTTIFLTIEAGSVSQPPSIELRPLLGSAEVRTDPPGARVVVNGEDRGRSPVVLPGLGCNQKHTVRAELANYEPAESTFTVTPGDLTRLPLIRLVEIGATLAINTTPPGASITIDKSPAGKSNSNVTVRGIRKHQIRLELHGYLPVDTTLAIVPGPNVLTRILVPRPQGRLRFQGGLMTQITLDGTDRLAVEAMAREFEVPEGQHKFTIRLGDAFFDDSIFVGSGETVTYDVSTRSVIHAP